jgi:hypothetical protein
MRATLPLFALLSGCWPYLPGSYDDYVDDSDDTDSGEPGDAFGPNDALIGSLNWTVYRGGYWDGPVDGQVDSTSLWFGVSAVAEPNYTGQWGITGSCTDTEDLTFPWNNRRDVGTEDVSLAGSAGTFALPWDPDSLTWGGTLTNPVNLVTGSSYTLAAFDTSAGGVVELDFRTPPNRSLTYPDIGASSIPPWDPTQPFVWTTNGQADVVLVVSLVDDSLEVIEQTVCPVDGSRGNFRLPSGALTRLSSAVGAYVDFITVREADPDPFGANGEGVVLVGSNLRQVGFVAIE